MKIAVNATDQLIHINQVKENQVYRCPECRKILMIKVSQKGTKYFAHQRSDGKSHRESIEHIQGKYQIYEWAKSKGWCPQLEVWLPSINQRADVLCNITGRQVAFEFQCSPLSLQAIKIRNHGYQLSNISFYWFLGQRYLKKIHPSKTAQFTQIYHNQPVLYFWNVNTNNLRIKHLQNNTKHILKARRETRQLRRFCFNNIHRHHLAQLAYQHGHILGCCPLFVHEINNQLPLLKQGTPEWCIYSLLKLEMYSVNTSFTIKQWRHLLISLGEWNEFPCLINGELERIRDSLMSEWTVILQKHGILETRQNSCIIKRKPVWFNNIDQKMMAIKISHY